MHPAFKAVANRLQTCASTSWR